MTQQIPDSSLFVIFGGTGDLSRRKLMPALARLEGKGLLGPHCHILAVARSGEHTDPTFRALARASLERAGLSPDDIAALCDARLHFQTIGDGTPSDFQNLKARIESLEKEHGIPGNRAFYLALPPGAFRPTLEGLGQVELNKSEGWTRIVVEKPFGRDLASAIELNGLVHGYFSEEQIYRIDHYLGKDTVQNLLVLRFANPIFESLWNRERIASVQITVAESLGVGTRAGYYDRSGALRDMVQNHIAQLLSLVAMEVPASYTPDSIRYEKIKVLKSIEPLKQDDVVFAQYDPGTVEGEEVPGYASEPGVPAGSTTPTFVALKASIDNWRWQGVPFYLRTGKRMPERVTRIVVRFRHAPVYLFNTMGACPVTSNLLVLTLQPDARLDLCFDVKVPGDPFQTKRIPLDFHYKDLFDDIPDAYETLLLDVLTGDQTLFVHADEVESSWQLFQPLIDKPPTTVRYAAGTWGPQEARRLAVHDPLVPG